MTRLARICLIALLSAAFAAGCAPKPAPADKDATAQNTPPATTGTPAPATPTAQRIPLRIYAVGSLNPALGVIANAYRTSHSGQECALTFGTSAELADRIIKSKGADLFLCDSPDAIKTLRDAGVVKDATIFLSNQLQIVTTDSKPTLLAAPEDLTKPAIKQIGIGPATSAEGIAARAYLTEQKLLPALESKLKEYPSDREVAEAVGKGEIAVGIVDAATAKMNHAVKVTLAIASTSAPTYIAAAITGSENTADATAFIAILSSQPNQDDLVKAGFSAEAARPLP